MQASKRRFGIGVLGCTVALIALVVALTPGAQASGGFKTCPNKTIKFKVEGPEGSSSYTTTVKDISTKGNSCAKVYEFLRKLYAGEGVGKSGAPQGYQCKTASFKAPAGYVPTQCTKPGKTIRYAGQGG